MKKLIVVVAAATLLCLVSSAAFAQYDEDEPSKVNLKVGYFMPQSSLARNLAGKSWSMLELTYDANRDEASRPTVQISFGLMEPFNSSGSSMVKLHADRLFWKTTKGDSSLFYGAGAGLYKMKSFRETELNTGGELFVGYNIRNEYTLELRGVIVQPMTIGSGLSAFDVNLSGLMICAGTRKLF
jgi:hypothetical protein